jgi:hypothetical protein
MAVNVTEEVRRDILDALEDMQRGQPYPTMCVLDQFIEIVRTAPVPIILDNHEPRMDPRAAVSNVW